MKNYPFILFAIFTLNNTLFSQSLTIERASAFIEAIIIKNQTLTNFVLPEELAISKRLGISYIGVENKFLISYEIPEKIIEEINNGKTDYTIHIEKIDDEFSILHVEYAEMNYKTKYFFQKDYLVSPPYYHYKDWQKIESEHFIFYVSEPKFFNQYSVDRLENFVNNIFSVLKFSEEEKQLLKKEKLIYLLCKDENEIEKLTGYKARGMGNLAYDYVITTYNCHYHELLHILINFKLKKLPLYTHPFLQEGFAVAFGGRGGYEPGIILNLGKFLEQSEFLIKSQLLNSDEYKTYDVSMSYPLSGLYNLFLIQDIGIDNYLNLYFKYSSENVVGSLINLTELPSELKWNDFINNFRNEEEIIIDSLNIDFTMLLKDSSYKVMMNESFYLFETKNNILISTNEKMADNLSKVYSENYPNNIYNGEKYLIKVDDSEVAIYNLFTNNLIANYASGFSIEMKPVPKEKDYYIFLFNKNLFDESYDAWSLTKVNE